MQWTPKPQPNDVVAVPRRLLCEILEDGTCPIHLRMQLCRVMRLQLAAAPLEAPEAIRSCSSIISRIEPCLPHVAANLPLAEVLAVRASSAIGLEWVMHRSTVQFGGPSEVHHRIRIRLWIQRVADLNRENADETVYETPVRRLADDALRRRMEAEMAGARHDMEQQIRAFQVEVDRRMEQQAVRVHAIVEERLQQQLDTILVAEMEKIRAIVEERVQGRVQAVVKKEVHTTVSEMQVRQAVLAHENERLRAALHEELDHSDLSFRSLVWALSPNSTGLFARALRLAWACRRRLARFSARMLGVPQRGCQGLRAQLEALHRAASDFQTAESMQGASVGAGSSPSGDLLQALLAPLAATELPGLLQGVHRELLMAVVATAAALPAEAWDGWEQQQRPQALPEVGPVLQAGSQEAASAGQVRAAEAAAVQAAVVAAAVRAEDEDDAESPRLSEPPSEDEEEPGLLQGSAHVLQEQPPLELQQPPLEQQQRPSAPHPPWPNTEEQEPLRGRPERCQGEGRLPPPGVQRPVSSPLVAEEVLTIEPADSPASVATAIPLLAAIQWAACNCRRRLPPPLPPQR